MCHLSSILLTSFQEELNLLHCQHPHYGGRENNGFHRNHPAGIEQRSTLIQTTWKSEICKLHVYKLKKKSQVHFPSLTDSSEPLLTAEHSYTTAEILKLGDNQPLSPHKIKALNSCMKMLHQLSYTEELKDPMEQQEVTNQQLSQDTTSIHRQGRSSQSRGTIETIHASLRNNASDDSA